MTNFLVFFAAWRAVLSSFRVRWFFPLVSCPTFSEMRRLLANQYFHQQRLLLDHPLALPVPAGCRLLAIEVKEWVVASRRFEFKEAPVGFQEFLEFPFSCLAVDAPLIKLSFQETCFLSRGSLFFSVDFVPCVTRGLFFCLQKSSSLGEEVFISFLFSVCLCSVSTRDADLFSPVPFP